MTAATQFITKTYQQPYRPADRSVTEIYDSADPYNEFIWELARKYTNSPEEAKAAVLEMQSDLQLCAGSGLGIPSNEDSEIERIAWRGLLKFLQQD